MLSLKKSADNIKERLQAHLKAHSHKDFLHRSGAAFVGSIGVIFDGAISVGGGAASKGAIIAHCTTAHTGTVRISAPL